MTLYQVPKGTKDILWEEFYARHAVATAILQVLERYGFRPVTTPGIEYLEVLQKQAGEAIVGQIYVFKDRAGRSLGLRSDITPAIARLIASIGTSVPKPIKIYSYGRVWRYEKPQAGRGREFWHIDVELLGSASPMADAELIACFCRCYEAAGLFDFEIHINHRKLLEEFVRFLGVSNDQILPVVRVIDKRQKLSHERFKHEVVEAGLPQSSFKDLMDSINLQGDLSSALRDALALHGRTPGLASGLAEIETVAELLRLYQVESRCKLNLGLARGFDYYTDVIFECVVPGNTGIGSIGGGGRYDHLVETFGGPPMPASGFAIGFERVMILLSEKVKIDNRASVPHPEYYMITINRSSLKQAIAIAEWLRSKGKQTEIDLMGRNVSRQLDHARRVGAKKALILGPYELARDLIRLRDMESGEESLVSVTDFQNSLQ